MPEMRIDQLRDEVERLKSLNAELVEALTALRAAVSIAPSMQGRSYIDLGIQVNAALSRAKGEA